MSSLLVFALTLIGLNARIAANRTNLLRFDV